MYVNSEDIKDKIPISESVRKLDRDFPHLRDIKWNERDKKEAEEIINVENNE